jgi:hypothetical protein
MDVSYPGGEKVFDLVAPELGLVLHLTLTREIADDEDGLVGDFRLFDAELEELFRPAPPSSESG